MHPESGPYVFFTAMAYVALRLLGVQADDPLVAQARSWLRAQRGAVLAIPSWGKFWLAILGLYGYEGVNPIVPELFVLPEAVPVHPNRYYCHTRYIYLGIAYLYGRRFCADLGPITQDLRRELHAEPFESIDFASHRHDLADTDVYVRPGPALRFAYDALVGYERVHSRTLRAFALSRCLSRIEYEVRASRYLGLSPVNGLLNCLALYADDPNHRDLRAALDGLEAWKWDDARDGIRYAGARSNAWDTGFAMRAALEAPAEYGPVTAVLRGYAYLRDTQLVTELSGGAREARDPVLGGWCFSDGQHRWPVSDCTAEALSAILIAHETPGLIERASERVSDDRLRMAAEFVLQRQNDDGGFGTYERRRGGAFLESLNPSEMYGHCMTERSYVECTASCISALCRFRARYPGVLTARLRGGDPSRRTLPPKRTARRRIMERILGALTSRTLSFHAVDALRVAGASENDPAIVRASQWLLAHQKANGAWGEHYSSCLTDRYVEHPEGQAVMTSWALLALMHTRESRSEAVARGIAWLQTSQQPDGTWPEEPPSRVCSSEPRCFVTDSTTLTFPHGHSRVLQSSSPRPAVSAPRRRRDHRA